MQAQTNCAMRYNPSEKAIQEIVYGVENRLRGAFKQG
nr:MAG TPA: Chromo domain-containing protein 2 [Caudoviricetes sp.]